MIEGHMGGLKDLHLFQASSAGDVQSVLDQSKDLDWSQSSWDSSPF